MAFTFHPVGLIPLLFGILMFYLVSKSKFKFVRYLGNLTALVFITVGLFATFYLRG